LLSRGFPRAPRRAGSQAQRPRDDVFLIPDVRLPTDAGFWDRRARNRKSGAPRQSVPQGGTAALGAARPRRWLTACRTRSARRSRHAQVGKRVFGGADRMLAQRGYAPHTDPWQLDVGQDGAGAELFLALVANALRHAGRQTVRLPRITPAIPSLTSLASSLRAHDCACECSQETFAPAAGTSMESA
jgi:hypothetical protein